MSASDNKMIEAIAKMYPKLNKTQITNFVKKKKKPIKSKIDPTTESIKEMLDRKLNDKK